MTILDYYAVIVIKMNWEVGQSYVDFIEARWTWLSQYINTYWKDVSNEIDTSIVHNIRHLHNLV